MKLFVVILCFYRKFELSRIKYKPKPNPNPGPGGLVLCTSVTTYNGKPAHKNIKPTNAGFGSVGPPV